MSDFGKKIAILLDKDLKDYTGLGYSYYRAFKQLGYDCNIIAYKVDLRVYKYIKFSAIARSLYLKCEQERIVSELEDSDTKLVFVLKGSYLKPATLKAIQAQGKTVICFNPDDPYGSIFGYSNSWIRSCITEYDAYFIWCHDLVKKIKRLGSKNVFYLPFAADTDIMKLPVYREANHPMGLSFIGNADEERIRFMTELGGKIEKLAGTMALYGKGWKGIPNFECNSAVFGEDYLSTMHDSAINLNVLRLQNKVAHNMRTFEVPAIGGFLLHEYSPAAANLFQEGVEMEFFRDADECARKIIYYSEHEDKRDAIAKAGYNKVIKAGYNYTGLVSRIEDGLKQMS